MRVRESEQSRKRLIARHKALADERLGLLEAKCRFLRSLSRPPSPRELDSMYASIAHLENLVKADPQGCP
jgi:hypothetical protein